MMGAGFFVQTTQEQIRRNVPMSAHVSLNVESSRGLPKGAHRAIHCACACVCTRVSVCAYVHVFMMYTRHASPYVAGKTKWPSADNVRCCSIWVPEAVVSAVAVAAVANPGVRGAGRRYFASSAAPFRVLSDSVAGDVG